MALKGGTAVVDVVANGDKLSGEIAKATTTGVQRASGPIAAAGTRLASVFSVAAGIGLAELGQAALRFGADSVAAFRESEQVLAQLRITVGGTTEAYEQQATALQNLTGVEDEQILAADTVLARFQLTTDEIQTLIPLVLDYAQAVGGEAVPAAEAIGKALLGNTRALKTIGIDFKATGDRGKDLANIMRLLEDRVGGSARAFGETASGQLAIAQARFNDVQEEIGERLIPVLNELLPILTDFAETVAPVITTALSAAVEQLKPFTEALSLLTGHADDTGEAIRSMAAAGLDFFVPGAHLGDLLREGSIASLEYTGSLRELKQAFGQNETAARGATPAIQRFGFVSKEAFGKFKEEVVQSVQVAVGQFDSLKDAFGTSTTELAKQARIAVRVARQQQEDLRTIFADKSLTPQMKAAIAALPAEQRHAFAEGGKKVREQIAEDAVTLQKLNERSFKQITGTTAKVARDGGKETGRALMDGAIAGVAAQSPALAAEVREAIAAAIQAGKDAAGIHSPSKVMEEMGEDLMLGLVAGITKHLGKVQDLLRGLVPAIQRAFGTGASDQARAFVRDLANVERQLDRIRNRALDFRTSIVSAFGDFGDLIGGIGGLLQADGEGVPDLHAFVAQQVQQAQQLAASLAELQAAGLNKELLAQLAEQGGEQAIAIANQLLSDPALIAQLNAAQEQIAAITQDTADQLTDAEFGDRLAHLAGRADELERALRRFLRSLDPESGHGPADMLKDLARALEKLLDTLGIDVRPPGMGGGGEEPTQTGGKPNSGPIIVIHPNAIQVNGTGDPEQVALKVRDEFVAIIRNNGSLGIPGGGL